MLSGQTLSKLNMFVTSGKHSCNIGLLYYKHGEPHERLPEKLPLGEPFAKTGQNQS